MTSPPRPSLYTLVLGHRWETCRRQKPSQKKHQDISRAQPGSIRARAWVFQVVSCYNLASSRSLAPCAAAAAASAARPSSSCPSHCNFPCWVYDRQAPPPGVAKPRIQKFAPTPLPRVAWQNDDAWEGGGLRRPRPRSCQLVGQKAGAPIFPAGLLLLRNASLRVLLLRTSGEQGTGQGCRGVGGGGGGRRSPG